MDSAASVVSPDAMIGGFEFTAIASEDCRADERRKHRAEAPAAWLLAEWRREQKKEVA